MSDAQLDSVRGRVTARRARLLHPARVAVVVAAMITAILVASTAWHSPQTPRAFAAEHANEVLFPTGAALHVVTTETNTGRTSETWLDVDRRQARHQDSVETSAGLQVASLVVMSEDRIRRLDDMSFMQVVNDPTFIPPDDVVLSEDPLNASAKRNPASWMLGWADKADRLMRVGGSAVSESATPDGDPAWSVAWSEGQSGVHGPSQAV